MWVLSLFQCCLVSKYPPLRQADRLNSPHHDVVEYPDIDQSQRILKPLGQCQIGAAGFGHAGRVVMREDHCRCVQGRALRASRGRARMAVPTLPHVQQPRQD